MSLLKPLTEAERDVMREMLIEGRPYEEIADAFDCTPSTISHHAKAFGLARRGVHKAAEPAARTVVIPAARLFGRVRQGDWVADALCAETDPESFFPERGGSTREAKGMCTRCQVRSECLEWAMETGERFGVWGGLSERERRKLATRRRVS